MKVSKEKNLIINVFLKTKKYRISKRRICTLARKVLNCLDVIDAELSICLVCNNYIRKLNKRYKNRNTFTDVLAFPFEIKKKFKSVKRIAGEIIISLDQTKINSKYFSNSFNQELLLYVIHGILHIYGYNDIRASDRLKMEKKQKEIFDKFVNDNE